MKYSNVDAVLIGTISALAIIMLVMLVIKLLPTNKDKYSSTDKLVNCIAFILNMIALATILFT